MCCLFLAACAAEPEPARSQPRFDPLAFFDGRTRGEGIIDPLVGSDTALRVDSVGRRDREGILLVQRIVEGDKPARIRRWRLKPVAQGRYEGRLTDAEGPVTAIADGNRLTIRYETPSGLAFEQYLALQPDRRTVANLITVRKFGIPVATVRETIRKLD